MARCLLKSDVSEKRPKAGRSGIPQLRLYNLGAGCAYPQWDLYGQYQSVTCLTTGSIMR